MKVMKRIIDPNGCIEEGLISSAEASLDEKRTFFVMRNKLRNSAGKKKLGIFWLILDPVAMSLVYLFVLTVVRSYPNFESLFIGVSMFRIFQSSFMSGVNSIKDFSGGIVCERVRSRVLVSASIKFRILEATLQSSGIAVILLVFLDVKIIAVISFIILSLLMGLFAEGVGLNLSGLVRRIPDLSNMVRYLLLLMFFGSPTLYPMSMTNGLHYRINEFNPFSYFVETIRFLADLDSEIGEFPEFQIFAIISSVVALAMRGYMQIDSLRWEVSSWS